VNQVLRDAGPDSVKGAAFRSLAVVIALGSDGPLDAPLESGRRALEKGDRSQALQHFTYALALAPGSPEILELLRETAANEPDALALWSHELCCAGVDASGNVRVSAAAQKGMNPEDPYPQKVASLRAQAVDELLHLAAARTRESARKPEDLLVAHWAGSFAHDLAYPCPALLKERFAEFVPSLEVPETLKIQVLKAIERAMNSALVSGRTEVATHAARVLHGFTTQGAFKDLQGPVPRSLSSFARSAQSGLSRVRQRLLERGEKPWTLEELELQGADQAEAFTRAHDNFASPGVALSETGLYRIETDCGYQTLLGAAQTVEQHHRRLARWFGADPFAGRPGIVRIVPDAPGLESEGSPFWWAGGFQNGDVTTVRFSCGSIEGLGHALTHELTHRFDAALHPGLPPWLLEGRAVWTGAAYSESAAETFVPHHAQFGTIEAAFIKGYGGLENLTRLIEGDLEDYRDNYTAGYALYVYLKSFEADGRALFAEPFLQFLRMGGELLRNPKAVFVRTFCDGKDGRPESLEAFAQGFGTFIAGFYWQDRKEWTLRYTETAGEAGIPPFVYDEPTWVWSRHRAEPCFGEDQASLAAELLWEVGAQSDAVAAWIWSLAADDLRPDSLRSLHDACRETERKDAAWIALQRLSPPGARCSTPAPFLSDLSRTQSLAATLLEAHAFYSSRNLAASAAAMRADHARVARWLGIPQIPRGGVDENLLERLLHPFDPPPRRLDFMELKEDLLTDYEERRVPGLWYLDRDRTLHVGRKEPRTETGDFDRRAHQVHAFTRGTEWITPGAFELRARVKFTTSFVSGALVLGYTRRDRNLRLNFSAGDFLYSIGAGENEPTFDSVSFYLSGLRDRDGPLHGSIPVGGQDFGQRATGFDFLIRVDGGLIQVLINGKGAGFYHTVDGAPIEGFIGFAADHGAYSVMNPTLTRMDRSREQGRAPWTELVFDLCDARTGHPYRYFNRPVVGLEPVPQGTLALFLPGSAPGEAEEVAAAKIVASARRAIGELAQMQARADLTQHMVLVIPALLSRESLANLKTEMNKAAFLDPEPVLHWCNAYSDPETESLGAAGWPWLLFIDSAGVLRKAHPFLHAHSLSEDGDFIHWLQVFRDHGRPARTLPEPTRGTEVDEDQCP